MVRFGDVRLDLQSGELEVAGARVILPEQPFRLLAILIRERGALVTRDDLRRELWPEGTFVDFQPSLNAAVKRVRDVLGDSAAAPRYIETLPKRGYRFMAPVLDEIDLPFGVQGAAAPVVDSTSSVPGTLSYPAGSTSEPLAQERRTPILLTSVRRRWTAVAMVFATGALLATAVRSFRSEFPSQTAAPEIERLTNDGTVRLAALSLDGRDVAYVRREGVRESLWLKKGDRTTASRLLAPIDGSFRSLTFAPGEILHYTVFRPDEASVKPFRVPTRGGAPHALLEPAGRIAFSREGSRCAYVSNFSLVLRESRILVSNADGHDVRVITVRRPPHTFVPTKPAWSPDGTRLVVFGISESAPSAPELLVVDVATGRTLQASPLALVTVDGALWLPDGEHVIISGRQRSAAPQRLWLFALAAGTLRPLTTDLSDYALVGLSAAQQVVAVRGEVARSLWTTRLNAPGAPDEVVQNAGDIGELEGLAWLSGDDILYTAAEGDNVDIWSVSISQRTRRRLSSDAADDFHPSATADGRTVVFASTRGGSPGLWMMDGDGGHQRRLTSGVDHRPSISRDGRILVFQRGGTLDATRFTLWRLPIGETSPAEVAPYHSMRPALSPDARSIAHYRMTAEAWMLAITPISGGAPAHMLPISATHAARVVRWSPDGRALAFIDGAGGASNIWLLPLDRGPARKLTNFSDGRITTFDWSPDGSRVAWTRVHEVRDVVALARPLR